jgi:MYXO-CTERM domain-containing protein
MTDASGWSKIQYYSTIRIADVDDDGKDDVCARAAVGMYCWISKGDGFETRITGPAFSDASGWDDPQYYRTIRAVDIDGDGKADLCARAAAGVRCYPSTGTGFGAAVTGPELSDALGWKAIQYYSTLRAGSKKKLLAPPVSCEPTPEICDGLDNDCDGVIDNGLDCNTDPTDGGPGDEMLGDAGGGDDGDSETSPIEGSCSCRVGGGGGVGSALLAAAAGAVVMAARRRRRKR